ncbi:hypothetical protein KDD17_04655 [Sulfitobacter albidus]|uniref:Uncharacterized protein n=2 Tax=Sulfitobacter albidus TaxID=2829501 RepID=A0A975PNK9_9RHOB|nr:hypothetical protein KDD17_04655 [Sulfitobacter albidus]
MRWIGIVLALAGGVQAQAEEWRAMDGAQIVQTLTGATVEYATAWQDFRASGRTLYNAGRDSWGYWAVRGDLYCSQWPPSDLWACYGMQRLDDRLRFIGAEGDVTEGRLRD